MHKNNPQHSNADDIESILGKIDEMVSVSDKAENIMAQTVPLSKIVADGFHDEGFDSEQRKEIEKGVDQQLPVKLYAKKCYNWLQMHELRRGLLENLDIGFYENPLFSASQMREIRLGLLDHLDAASYARHTLPASDMRQSRKVLFSQAYKNSPTSFGRSIIDDSGIRIRISDDCMEAFIRLPAHFDAKLSESDLVQILESHGITQGVISENIRKVADERPIGKEICVARGKRPVTCEPGWYELFFDNSIENGYTVPPDDEINYAAVKLIETVQPEQILAKYHPAQKNPGGITVTGIPIDGEDGEELPILTGTGFERDEEQNAYIATETGHASYNEATNSLNVWNVYQIQGDFSYYQSLQYDGTVHVTGSVRSMAVIRAKGDIIIDGFVENAFIEAEQSIVIKGGVNGGSQGKIEAGGSIRSKFFENANIKAKGLIESNYFLNTKIFTDDRIIARGKKARIMGGDVTSAIGIEAVIIGNYMGTRTRINVGDIHEIDRRLSTQTQNRQKSYDELQQLSIGRQKLSLLLGEEDAPKNELYKKTLLAIETKENELHDFDREIDRLKLVLKRAKTAYVTIHREMQADTILTINGYKKKLGKDITKNITLTREQMIMGNALY